MNFKILSILAIFISLSSIAQDLENLNSMDIMGTSRTLGLSGTQSVLGADPGSLYHNPASGGLFRKSEVSITPSFGSSRLESSYLNQSNQENSPFSVLNNLAFVFATTDDSKEKGFKNYTLGFTYNRVATFYQNTSIEVFNPNHSFTTYLGEYVTADVSENPDNLNINGQIDDPKNLSEMAWKSFLINIDDDSTFYGIAKKGGVSQNIDYEATGFVSSWNFNASTNYEDFLYLGAGLDVNNYEFSSRFELNEDDINDTIQNFKSFTYENTYASSSTPGYALNLGVIIKPIQFWRLGISYKSQMKYSISSVSDEKLNDVIVLDSMGENQTKSFFVLGNVISQDVKSAASLTLGNYIQFGKTGFFTTDFRYRFTSNLSENVDYNNLYRISSGLEFRKDFLRFRGGFGFKNNLNQNSKNNTFWSLGAGVRSGPYFFDFSFNRFGNNFSKEAYTLNEFYNFIDFKSRKNLFSFSTGVRF